MFSSEVCSITCNKTVKETVDGIKRGVQDKDTLNLIGGYSTGGVEFNNQVICGLLDDEALMLNKKSLYLQQLELDDNTVVKSASFISTTLVNVGFNVCKLTDKQLVILILGIKASKKLSSLEFSFSDLKNAQPLAEYIEESTTLTHLKINEKLTENEIGNLAKAIQNSKSLLSISFYKPKNTQALNEAVLANKKIIEASYGGISDGVTKAISERKSEIKKLYQIWKAYKDCGNPQCTFDHLEQLRFNRIAIEKLEYTVIDEEEFNVLEKARQRQQYADKINELKKYAGIALLISLVPAALARANPLFSISLIALSPCVGITLRVFKDLYISKEVGSSQNLNLTIY